LYVRGATSIYLDEVDEARRVVDEVARYLRAAGVVTTTYHDDVSHSQDENLDRIVDFHNAQTRDLDASVHFNAYLPPGQTTDEPKGTEVFYVTQSTLAAAVSEAIADAGDLIDRGAKTGNLYFLNQTEEPAILIEVCFVDSKADAQLYKLNFDSICGAMAATISGMPVSPPERPERPPPEAPPIDSEHPLLEKGDSGPAVIEVQRILGLPADGDFGSVTEAGVEQFQRAAGLSADGVVGDHTWAALDDLDVKMRRGSDGIDDRLADKIDILCARSPVNDIDWDDRGQLPAGFYAGMAKTYALVLSARHEPILPAVQAMAHPSRGDAAHDALALYEEEFEDMNIDVRVGGTETLRALFILMIGLGARESSGDHWCGRDMTADNVESDTAEAGFAQTSWNISNFSPTIPPLLQLYWDDPNGFLPTFDRDCPPPDSEDLNAYGSGDGARYQFLAKHSPAFHALVTGVGMRLACTHWGPIKYGEVDLVEEVQELLQQVEALVDQAAVA
jgi:hypothetical protein